MTPAHNTGITFRHIQDKWKDILAVILLVVSTVVVYRWVPQTYFQQDEWYSMGKSLLAAKDPSVLFYVVAGIHVMPISQIWYALQYYFFGINPVPYLTVSVLSHCTAVILGYLLLRTLSLRIIPSFLGIAFFALNPVSSQVVTWISASVIGSSSVILFLSGIILWIRSDKKRTVFTTGIISLLLFFALFAKEDIIVGFVFICVLYVFGIRKKTASYTPILISLATWFILYTYIWIFGKREDIPLPHKTFSEGIVYITAISSWMGNTIITQESIRAFLQRIFDPYAQYVSFIQNDAVLKSVSVIVSSAWYVWYAGTSGMKKVAFRKIVFFPMMIVFSMLPYFLSPSVVLEGRHYYIPVFITGMWIAWYLDWSIRNKYRMLTKCTIVFLLTLLTIFGFANQPRTDYLPYQVKKEKIVSEMLRIATPSAGTLVYYFKDGSSSPFQSGIGQMLLVLHARTDKTFIPYFRTMFLWGTFEEGYKKIGEKGFGYYYNLARLKKDFQDGLFPAETIRAYIFDPEKRTIQSTMTPDLMNL